MIKRKEKTGDLIKVPFDEPYFTYAQYLTDTLFAFYDFKSVNDIQEICQVLDKMKLFTISVHASAVRSNRWKIVGSCELPENSKENFLLFKNKIIAEGQPAAYTIYKDGITRDATREECMGLEYLFAWTPEKVEERLRDHYAGRLNFQAEYYRIKD